MNFDFFRPSAAAAAVLAVACTGCFDREVPRRQVTAHGMEEAAANRGAVTFIDLHASGPGDGPLEFPEGLGAFPALSSLSVRGRSLVSGVPESVAEAKGLEMLDLAGTGVKDLPQSLTSMPSLRRLYLSDNSLDALPPAVSGIFSLEYLNLDRNGLSELPDSVGSLSSLKWMRLNRNRLSDLPASAGDGWRSIRKLYLRGNGLKEVPAAVLRMASLEELDLGENDISEIPPELCRLPKLRRIDLDSNPRLSALPANVGEMKALTHLFLFRCAVPPEEQARIRAALPDPVRQFIAF